jgi:hypothetical protein
MLSIPLFFFALNNTFFRQYIAAFEDKNRQKGSFPFFEKLNYVVFDINIKENVAFKPKRTL